MKIEIKDIIEQISDSPEYNQILGEAREQGRISGILIHYKEKYPEFNNIFDEIMKEIFEKHE